MKPSTLIGGLLLATLAGAPEFAVAGPFADDMGKCMVAATSSADRTVFVKWIFTIITLHPDLESMSAVSPQQREAIAKDAGALLQRLLLESCRSQARQAVQNEGPQTIEYAFQILGQVATRGLFADSHVTEGAKGLGKFVDEEKIKQLLTTPEAAVEPKK